jgi:tetratricopeptide (TPR) repeat protein
MPAAGAQLPPGLASADAALAEGRYADALTAAHRALADPQVHASRPWLALAYYIIGRASHELGEDREARGQFELAARLTQDCGDEVLALRCQLALAQADHHAGDLATALHASSLVLARARELELPEIEAGALATIGNIAWKRGDLAAAAGDLARAAALYDRLGQEMSALRARVTLGYVQTMQGEVATGRALMQSCLDGLLAAGDYQAAAKTLCNLAYAYFAEGDLAEARDLLLRSTELDERHRNRHLSLGAWFNLGLIELAQGWRAAAQHSFTRAHALAQLLGDRPTENMSLLYLGALELFAHEPGEALHFFQLGYDNFTGMEVQERRIAEYFLAVGQLAAGAEEAARELWDKRTDPAEMPDCLDDFQLLRRLLAELLTPAYVWRYELSSQVQFTAGRWLDMLARELAEIQPERGGA